MPSSHTFVLYSFYYIPSVYCFNNTITQYHSLNGSLDIWMSWFFFNNFLAILSLLLFLMNFRIDPRNSPSPEPREQEVLGAPGPCPESAAGTEPWQRKPQPASACVRLRCRTPASSLQHLGNVAEGAPAASPSSCGQSHSLAHTAVPTTCGYSSLALPSRLPGTSPTRGSGP